MSADDSRLATLALDVLYSAASIKTEHRHWITNIGTGESTTPVKVVTELTALNEPVRLVGLNCNGTLAVGWWPVGITTATLEQSPRFVGVRALLMEDAEEPGPTVFLRTDSAIHSMDVTTAARFLTMFQFVRIYSRRLCEVYQHELRQLLEQEHGARKKDLVLEFRLQLGGSSQMHGRRAPSAG